ncbi:MAG: PAS domain S-box protein [Chloroflexi bacterium]|nr:PAS domain S-box protein [Chloroflexota bacterium]
MKNEQKTGQQQMDKPLHDLIDIIQFAENVTAKILGLRDEAEIFKVVIDEFSNSDRFVSTILLLSDDGLSIKLSDTSLSSHNLKTMEKAAGVFKEHYKIDLSKSRIFSRVVRDGETIMATGPDIIGELFPRPLVTVLVKLMGLGNQSSILTPLYRHEKITGILSLSAPELGDLFITSVKNLAYHVTIAMELADEHTERKRAEDALRDSEEKYRSLVEQSLQGHLIFQDDRIVFTNQAFANITGYPIKELMDFSPQYVRELVHPDDRKWVFERFNDRMKSKTVPPLYEYRLIRKNSSVCWIETHIDRINYLGNLAMQATFLDITERKQAEEETKKLNTQLMEANVVLEEEISERKRAEEAQRDSEEKLRMIFDAIGDGVSVSDLEGTIVETNQAFFRMFGHTEKGEIIGRNAAEFIAEKDHPKLMDHIKEQLETETCEAREYTLVDRLGREFASEIKTALVRDSLGNPVRFIAVKRDITERKRAEEALQKSEAHWRSLVENAPNIIMSTDSDGIIWSINRIVPGLTSEQVIGSKIYDFIDPEFHNTVRQTTKRVIQTGNPGTYEIRGTGPDGSVSWYVTQIGPVMQDQEIVALTLITTDITDRKNSEEEVVQRNRELAALNEIAQKISQTLDLDEILNNALDKTLEILNTKYGVIAFMDDEAESLTIRTARGTSDDLVNTVSPIKLGEVDKSIWKQLREPLFIESLSDWIERISSESLISALKQPIESAMFVPLRSKGEILGVICAFTESGRVFTQEERGLLITIGHQISTAIENAQLLEEVSRAEALEELDKLRTALLASVSHELRTPLTSIKGLASTLTQPDVEWDTETQQDFLNIIDQETDILTHIVEDLMQMSQMEAGIMSMDKTRSNIASIVHQLGNKLSDLTVAHEFETDIPTEMAPIYADEIRIGEVITNLVHNAASYSEQGTAITLVANEKDGQIIVSLTDHGIGIPPEHVDKVFDRFYRLESGVSRRRGGTGLGLSICKGIVESHNGEIWVKSTPDKGSTFSFSLPIEDDSEMVSAEQIKQ